MRTVSVTFLLLALAFAGCISDETPTANIFDPTNVNGLDLTKMPKRSFEPTLVLEPESEFITKNSQLNLTFDITDMHDYEFPLTFIDWFLFYKRNPNPVHEGDANALPGEWNVTAFAEGYHIFAFIADDGQGFKDRAYTVVGVGTVDPNKYPNATVFAEFDAQIDKYLGELEEVEEEVVEEEEVVLEGVYERYWKVLTDDSCYACYDGSSSSEACVGWQAEVQDVDCAWIPLAPGAAGNTFSVKADSFTSIFGGAPDVDFYDVCDRGAELLFQYYDPNFDEDTVTGVIPEGAGCMVAYNFGLVSAPTGGVMFEFEWIESAAAFAGLDVTLYMFESCGNAALGCNPGEGDCAGMATFENGMGCVWISFAENARGKTYNIQGGGNANSADPAGHFLSECSVDAAWVGPDYDSATSETGTVPEEAGCVMVYNWLGGPASIRIRIAA